MRLWRVVVLFTLLLSLFPVSAFAAGSVSTYSYYVPFKDQYRVDHDGPGAGSFQTFRVEFTSAAGQIYTLNFTYYTGIFWLTCNGKYVLKFLDTSGGIISQSKQILTTQIINPTCDSYQNQTGSDDLSATYSDVGSGKYNLNWTPKTGATKYEIWKDGQKVAETTGNTYTMDGQGSVSIVARDAAGNEVGQSDIQVPQYSGQYNTNCDTCEKLQQLLNCPGWNDVMGNLTEAIRNALPPPPDWPNIAKTFADATVDAFDKYLGEIPPSPTTDEIKSRVSEPFPNVDATFPEASNLKPSVPNEYNQPQTFDISSGPQIKIVDESQPFDIPEPLSNMPHDAPGVPVYPKDPRNSSNGIKQPDRLNLPVATPSKVVDPVTPVPAPVPTHTGGGTGATPGHTAGGVAIPTPTTGPIPIPSKP